MCSADSCSRMYRLVFVVSAVEAAVRNDLKQLMTLLTLIQKRVGKLVEEHGETLPCAPHCLWLLAWVERNDKPFSLHVLFTCTSLCIYFPDLLYLDGLYFFCFSRAKLSFGGACLVYSVLVPCLCPTWCECWRRWCSCAGWRRLPSASAAGLPARSADTAVLAWAVTPGALTVLGPCRDFHNPYFSLLCSTDLYAFSLVCPIFVMWMI